MNLITLLAYTAAPIAATFAGAVFAASLGISERFRSVIQHFAAGVVFAAAAAELLPDIVERHAPLEVAIGFALGVAAMVGVRALTKRLSAGGSQSALGLIVTSGVDIFIDGALIGSPFPSEGPRGC